MAAWRSTLTASTRTTSGPGRPARTSCRRPRVGFPGAGTAPRISKATAGCSSRARRARRALDVPQHGGPGPALDRDRAAERPEQRRLDDDHDVLRLVREADPVVDHV